VGDEAIPKSLVAKCGALAALEISEEGPQTLIRRKSHLMKGVVRRRPDQKELSSKANKIYVRVELLGCWSGSTGHASTFLSPLSLIKCLRVEPWRPTFTHLDLMLRCKPMLRLEMLIL
jgi:hypothetical protein